MFDRIEFHFQKGKMFFDLIIQIGRGQVFRNQKLHIDRIWKQISRSFYQRQMIMISTIYDSGQVYYLQLR